MFVLKVVQSLKKHKIQFAIVGGYAVALHGVTRGTVDIDLVVTLTKDSFKQTQTALEGLGLVSRLPVNAEVVFSFREDYIKNRNLIAWSFYNPSHPLEVVDVLITEDFRKISVETKRLAGESIPIISKVDLIKMKKKSGRPQDLEDVKALESL